MAQAETRPLVGKHIPAQVGMRVAMSLEYRSEVFNLHNAAKRASFDYFLFKGLGIITYVDPGGGRILVLNESLLRLASDRSLQCGLGQFWGRRQV